MLDPKKTAPQERSSSARTRNDFEIDGNLIMDTCCEPNCKIPVLVDKDMKESNRQVRCTACFMRFKMRLIKDQ